MRSYRSWRTAVLAVAVVATLGLVGATADTGDPLWEQQWGPRQISVEGAWPTTTGAGATIAVVDSGVDLDHPDLAANVVPGNTFLDCGPSGCGDGDTGSGGDAGHPHGTHVAGIAAAVAGNGIGIKGVAPDATILPVKALGAGGSGSFADIAFGIRWAAANGADVINLSLGALPGSQLLETTGLMTDVADAVRDAIAGGVVVVAAAGNETFPLCSTPAFNAGVLCVGATDQRELPASYGNFPIKADLRGVVAPGGSGLLACDDVVSTVPPGAGGTCGLPDAYDSYAGTSMATPHVAGVAALLVSAGCPGARAVDLITSTARLPLLGLGGLWTPAFGYGIVDAEAAVAACTG